MDKKFSQTVSNRPGGENINYCYSCGSCTATCPISELDQSYNPRLIIKKVLLGMREEVLASDNLWKCIQCHRCVAHCPQNVKFADIMRVLRELSVDEGYFPETLLNGVEQLDHDLWEYRLKLIKKHLEQGVKEGKEFISFAGGEDDD